MKLNEQMVETLSRLVREGCTNKRACTIAGISQSTFYRWVNQPSTSLERELSDALKKASAERIHMMEQKIIAAADDTWQAAAWYLERTCPEEYGKPDRYHDQGIAEAVNAVKELTESIKAKADAADL